MKKIILMLIVITFFCGCSKYSDEDIKQIIKNGNVIVKALEEYKKDINNYPKELKELMPKYLKEISKTGIDNELFRYRIIPEKFADEYYYGFRLYAYDSKEFIIIGSKSINRLVYYPSRKYPQRRFERTHKVIDGWAYQTIYRRYGKSNTAIE